jgi:small subunit ribosomal protein S8
MKAMLQDPIADVLARIRNALLRRMETVDVPASKVVRGLLAVMQAEGYIRGFDEIQDNRQGVIRIQLKYGPDGEQVMTKIRRESKSSRRLYKKADEIQPVLGGLGISILSTPQGIMSDRQARKLKVGGELLCTIW